MKSKLLLFFDTNVIIPVSCDAGGRTHETEPMSYSAVPNFSHIEIIRNFYQKTTGVNTIDTHFVFAETMAPSFKKDVMDSFSKEGITPVSFTTIPSIVLTNYALRQIPGNKTSFGENVVIIYSNDESLRLTGTIYDGNVWQWNVTNNIIPKVGNSPLKRALVECLINERDKHLGAIDARNREKEVEYQMQFVDEWLPIYKKLESREDLIVNFKFSFEDDFVKLRIQKREIELSYEQTLAPAISAITDYREKKCSNSVKYAILIGPAFEEENFTFKVKTALECHERFSVIPYTRLSKIFAEYIENCELIDDLSKFNEINSYYEKLYKNNLEWIQYAQVLTEFNEQLNAELSVLSAHVADDTKTLDTIISATDLFLRKSAFADAREALDKTIFPSMLVNNSIQEARLLLAKKENMEGVFGKLEYVDGARQLIKKIQDNSTMMRNEIVVSESHRNTIVEKSSQIDFLENHYDDYLDLKREFNKAPDYKSKKEIVEKMRDITLEPLPELKLRQVIAEINYTKEILKYGFLKTKKKYILNITVFVKDGDILPCDALLNVSNKVQIRASEGGADCLAYEISKGESTFSVSIECPNDQLDIAKPIYCYLFVGKNVLDKSAIVCESVIIKCD